VRQLLHQKIRSSYLHPQFVSDVTRPMNIEELIDQDVQHLSGGELQRVALVLCLGKPANVYLLDEPSAYLDSEQRIVASKVIKRYAHAQDERTRERERERERERLMASSFYD